MAAIVDLYADKRAPFIDDDGATWVFFAEAWDDAAFAMHIRALPGDTGAPMVSLTGASAGVEGISATEVDNYTYVDPWDGTMVTGPATLVLCQINEATLEGLSLGTPYDMPVQLHYDLHVTPSSGAKRVAVEGKFLLKPGVTI